MGEFDNDVDATDTTFPRNGDLPFVAAKLLRLQRLCMARNPQNCVFFAIRSLQYTYAITSYQDGIRASGISLAPLLFLGSDNGGVRDCLLWNLPDRSRGGYVSLTS
ncbi:uncharacterized protein RSE6_05304 [Rhynchosporium secalis]|uniref:Uncharacterized protein n=1 Tax=Rhynchosporium secalis TaxID=38038 RepID=A0A1E1M7F4_RHYSE|nr:uncharacterized protein RSE6_05304 [Rhynchosporium secalis]